MPGWIGWICKTMQCIPVDRDAHEPAPVREALRRLRDGRLVGIFPEGRINREDRLLPGIPGVAWLALRANVPVIPVFVENAPGGRNMVEPFKTFSRVRIIYGDPIDLSTYRDRRVTRELLVEVTDLLMGHLAALGGVEATPAENLHEPAIP